MDNPKIIEAIFFRTEKGNMPVREWLASLTKAERKIVGSDIQKVEFGWPIGRPHVGELGSGLKEIRSSLDKKITRVIFFIDGEKMVLLHAFIKKSQQVPKGELEIAKSRLRLWKKRK